MEREPNLQVNDDVLGAEAANEPVLSEPDRDPDVDEQVLRFPESFVQNFANQIQKKSLVLKKKCSILVKSRGGSPGSCTIKTLQIPFLLKWRKLKKCCIMNKIFGKLKRK